MGVKRLHLGHEPRTERAEFRVTLTHRKALDRIAYEKRRTLSSLLEEWIDELVEKNPEK